MLCAHPLFTPVAKILFSAGKGFLFTHIFAREVGKKGSFPDFVDVHSQSVRAALAIMVKLDHVGLDSVERHMVDFALKHEKQVEIPGSRSSKVIGNPLNDGFHFSNLFSLMWEPHIIFDKNLCFPACFQKIFRFNKRNFSYARIIKIKYTDIIINKVDYTDIIIDKVDYWTIIINIIDYIGIIIKQIDYDSIIINSVDYDNIIINRLIISTLIISMLIIRMLIVRMLIVSVLTIMML